MSVMAQATLWTPRIQLVPLSEQHLEYEVELDADPEVMRYLGKGRARTRQEVEILHRQRLAAATRIPGLGFWVGFVEGTFVGWWILEHIFAETMAVNAPSRATMTSVGMRHVRTFHLDWDEPLPGSDLGEVEYAITREQWQAHQAPDRNEAARQGSESPTGSPRTPNGTE